MVPLALTPLPRRSSRPRDGPEAAGAEEAAGFEWAETTTDWVPAVMSSAHTTITVYVPGRTLRQTADWPATVPASAARRPWAKPVWPGPSSEAVPQAPLT